jgi:hypothetical protein
MLTARERDIMDDEEEEDVMYEGPEPEEELNFN